MKVERNE